LLTQITDAAGQVSTFEYAGAKLTRYRDPANRATTFNYSGQLLASVTLPDGKNKSFQYDQNGQMTEETNQRGKKNQYAYNRFNRLERVFDANNSSIQVNDFATQSMTNSYVGGSVGQLQGAGIGPTKIHDTVVDSKSNTTEIAKDFNGFISIIKDAAGRTTQLNRDTEGKIIKIIRPDNSAVELSYNESTNDLISSKEVSLDQTESQAYNSYGQVTTYTNANNQTVTNTYDGANGLLTKRSNPDGSYLSYSYNLKGLPVAKTAVNGASSLTTQYEYDLLGRVTKITDQAGKFVRYTYDTAGNVLQAIATANGVDQITTSYTYDEFNRIKTVTSPQNEVTTYNYLPTGELSQIVDPKGKITQFDYDNRGQLIKKTDPNGKIYELAYDS
ncbi:MAG: hypothetical protein K2P92_03880, partial [Bdellovibrionaceae bacterium]|nr:hypothetical protein [Pseudobdellovibrionaceae bacterium]